jgi:hypothetical protein
VLAERAWVTVVRPVTGMRRVGKTQLLSAGSVLMLGLQKSLGYFNIAHNPHTTPPRNVIMARWSPYRGQDAQ